MGWNVPDDWGMYYTNCQLCGSRYHMSEGGCDCWEVEEERRSEETIARLKDAGCTIDGLEREPARTSLDADFGGPISKGETEVRIFITEKDGVDELIFTEESWAELKALIGFKEPANNDGRSRCWWCGEPTRRIPGLKEQVYDVCSDSDCGR